MSLVKETKEDKIEVVGDYKAIQIRTNTLIKENGVVISNSFSRRVIHPCVKDNGTWSDYSLDSESSEVTAIANAVWTDSCKTSYKTMMDGTLST